MEKEINKETIIRDLSLVQKEKQSKSKAMIDQKTDCVHEPQTVIKKSVGGEKKVISIQYTLIRSCVFVARTETHFNFLNLTPEEGHVDERSAS